MASHNGWRLVRGGWLKVGEGKGSAGYFEKEKPPMRDKLGRPLCGDGRGGWMINTALWIQEVNEGKWKKPS